MQKQVLWLCGSLCLSPLSLATSNEVLNSLNQLEQLDARQQHLQHSATQFEQAKPDQSALFSQPVLEQGTFLIDEQPCFSIQKIDVLDYGNQNIQPSQFQWAYKNALKQLKIQLPLCLGSQSLNALMKTIQNQLIKQGYVTTRVVIPEQDLTTGKLVLTIIPGRLRHIRIEDKSAVKRFSILTAWAGIALRQGEWLNVRDIEQSLENLTRVPTAEVTINIIPAQENAEIGESDLLVQYNQHFPFRLTLGLDDSGSEATGRLQGSTTLSIDNLLTANDLFYTSFTQSLRRPDWLGKDEQGERQSHSFSWHYSIPWRYWLLSFQQNQYRYHQQVAGAYGTTLNYAGESQSSKLSLSRVLFRNHLHKTTVTASIWTKKSRNFIDVNEVLVQRKRTGGWELGLQHKWYWHQATVEAGVHFKRGTGLNNALPYADEKFNEGTSRMKILSANLNLTYPFQLGKQQFVYQSQWQAQWNKTPLIHQDQFSIGGRYSVRGTDGELTLSAERGWLWRNELAWQLGNSGQQLYVTLDKGKVSGNATEHLLGTTLIGTSIGLKGGWKGLKYDVFMGKPVHVPQGFRARNTVLGFQVSLSF